MKTREQIRKEVTAERKRIELQLVRDETKDHIEIERTFYLSPIQRRGEHV